MKVLFYAPLSVLSYHHETDLELIKKHIEAGDDIKIVVCRGDLKEAGYSACAGVARCAFCSSRSEEGLHALGITQDQVVEIKTRLVEDKKYSFKNLADLKAYEYQGADVGMAVASTLISYIRESDPDVLRYKNYIQKSMEKTIGIYDWFDGYFKSEKPDLFYFFNGRFTLYRPALRAAQKYGVRFYVHERSGALARYSLNENTYPHDLTYKKNEILNSVNGVSPAEVAEVATLWYEKRAGKTDDAWYAFTRDQKAGALPEKIMTASRAVSIYISSEDEFEAIAGWENPLFRSQAEGVKFLLDSFSDNPEIHFFIRIHPNLIGLRNSQIKNLMDLKRYVNATIIDADEDIDTYELMRRSEKILTFGSTMGMEAVFHGKPSILVGRSLYESLNGPYIPKTRDELVKLIAEPLKVQPKDGALIYGYWLATYGHPFKYFLPTGLSRGTFLGKEIRGSRFWRLFSYFTYGLLQVKQVLKGELAFKVVLEKIKAKLT